MSSAFHPDKVEEARMMWFDQNRSFGDIMRELGVDKRHRDVFKRAVMDAQTALSKSRRTVA